MDSMFVRDCPACYEDGGDPRACYAGLKGKLDLIPGPPHSCGICCQQLEAGKSCHNSDCASSIWRRYGRVYAIAYAERNSWGLEGLIKRLKFGCDRPAAVPLGRLVAGFLFHNSNLLDGYDWIVPVPKHPDDLGAARQIDHNYEVLSVVRPLVGDRIQVDTDEDRFLIKRKQTARLSGIATLAERATTVMGAYQVEERWREMLSGTRILLFDDFYTNGVTKNECAGALREAGASTVDVFVMAREPWSQQQVVDVIDP